MFAPLVALVRDMPLKSEILFHIVYASLSPYIITPFLSSATTHIFITQLPNGN
jgi:hypothetical protein